MLYSKESQLYIYMYPLFFGFPFYLGYCRALTRIPCARVGSCQSSILYIVVNNVTPNLPVLPLVSMHLVSTKQK